MLTLILIITTFSPNHISCDEIKFPANLKFGEKLSLKEAGLLGDEKVLGLQRGSSGHVDQLKAGSYEWQAVWDKYISGYKFVVIIFFNEFFFIKIVNLIFIVLSFKN